MKYSKEHQKSFAELWDEFKQFRQELAAKVRRSFVRYVFFPALLAPILLAPLFSRSGYSA